MTLHPNWMLCGHHTEPRSMIRGRGSQRTFVVGFTSSFGRDICNKGRAQKPSSGSTENKHNTVRARKPRSVALPIFSGGKISIRRDPMFKAWGCSGRGRETGRKREREGDGRQGDRHDTRQITSTQPPRADWTTEQPAECPEHSGQTAC